MIDSVSNQNIKMICMNMNFATNSSKISWHQGYWSAGVSTSEHLVDSEAVS